MDAFPEMRKAEGRVAFQRRFFVFMECRFAAIEGIGALGAFRPLVVFPQGTASNESFLAQIGLNVADVRQVDFTKLGVSATPTLILTDNGGQVVAD